MPQIFPLKILSNRLYKRDKYYISNLARQLYKSYEMWMGSNGWVQKNDNFDWVQV